jgi:MFS family permease
VAPFVAHSKHNQYISNHQLTQSKLLWGRIADVYGKRPVFILGSIWVTITSLLCPFVRNEIGFDILRGLQGLGVAATVPTAIGILGVTFPPGKAKNFAFSSYAAGPPLGAVIGNIYGGILCEYLDWKWVFWVYAIMAGCCTVAGILVIPKPPPEVVVGDEPAPRKTVDWIGGAIITVGLVMLLFALSEGNVVGWSTAWVPILIVLSVLLVALFAYWQYRLEKSETAQPLMKISIFKNWRFSAANIIMLLFFSSFNNFLIFCTYWFQDFQGLSVIQTTIRFIPTGATGSTY